MSRRILEIEMPETTIQVTSERELRTLVQRLQEQAGDDLLLFRGQTDLFESVRSGRARAGITPAPSDVVRGWDAVVGRILVAEQRLTVASPARQAMLQHYGLATNYLDLTYDASIAAWFAVNEYSRLRPMLWLGTMVRRVEIATYQPVDEGIGYVLVFRVRNPERLREQNQLVDLDVSDVFSRPGRQQAVLMMDYPPLLPDPNSLWAWTVPIDRSVFASSFEQQYLFPRPQEDPGYAQLLSTPFVQVPTPYYADPPDVDEDDEGVAAPAEQSRSLGPKEAWRNWGMAMRAISIVEYVEGEDGPDSGVDHKWDDLTLYEPVPVRLWKWWNFRLSDLHPAIEGKLQQTSKVTIAPQIWDMLEQRHGGPLGWPDLGSNDLFFTFAALDHDKVIDHNPPYHGLWLHRDGDLIIEQGMVSDEETLSVTPGHGYLLLDGELRIYTLAGGCGCGQPHVHQRRVEALLRLHDAVNAGAVALLAHPFGIRDWFVAV